MKTKGEKIPIHLSHKKVVNGGKNHGCLLFLGRGKKRTGADLTGEWKTSPDLTSSEFKKEGGFGEREGVLADRKTRS